MYNLTAGNGYLHPLIEFRSCPSAKIELRSRKLLATHTLSTFMSWKSKWYILNHFYVRNLYVGHECSLSRNELDSINVAEAQNCAI